VLNQVFFNYPPVESETRKAILQEVNAFVWSYVVSNILYILIFCAFCFLVFCGIALFVLCAALRLSNTR
jgi:hypothetical protein